MTDRKKLIMLLGADTCGYDCEVCKHRDNEDACIRYLKESLADHLLANGVTVQKWIPVTERLPELIPCNAGTAYSEAVIVWTDGKKAMIAVWDGIDFLCAADYWEAWGENITHWMPLPEPPKMDGGAEDD